MWAYAKIFGSISGLLPRLTLSLRVLDYVNLERGLMIGVALLVAGLGLNLWFVQHWYEHRFGPLELDMLPALRHTLWGFTAMVLGVQTIISSFFLSMLGMMKKRDVNSPLSCSELRRLG
jgi:hypothetical protein